MSSSVCNLGRRGGMARLSLCGVIGGLRWQRESRLPCCLTCTAARSFCWRMEGQPGEWASDVSPLHVASRWATRASSQHGGPVPGARAPESKEAFSLSNVRSHNLPLLSKAVTTSGDWQGRRLRPDNQQKNNKLRYKKKR